ncbi:glycine-rich domain-containing protein [Spirosoma sordidisoli]|uniref:Glycine-rich domain-containing protein-like n=1 Tax=Spirosoma sordidisoli TaxID=2502893 RepID=A0A4V1RVC2_9BACT|nr:hypothetical protein [Spirosoma sordidisoli]RYC66258.1 hypothetical protein EQG79_30615 [Spirosoma sordidisoli]
MQNQTTKEIWERLGALNLDPIKIKLMNPDEDEGEPLTRDKADEIELWYKRFLFLLAKYPEKNIVPTKSVDKFWHQHILDTRKYAHDCEKTFGYFIHHFPYFGMRGDEDMENLKKAFSDTIELYTIEFGESPLGMRTRCCCQDCHGRCMGDSGDDGGVSYEPLLGRPSFA